jgi:hypothetical protein
MLQACLGPLFHAANSAHRGHFRVISPTMLSEKYKLENLVLLNCIYLLLHLRNFQILYSSGADNAPADPSSYGDVGQGSPHTYRIRKICCGFMGMDSVLAGVGGRGLNFDLGHSNLACS